MAELADLWPLYRLRLRVGDLELRLPDEGDLAALAELAGGRIHDPEVMPFSVAWTDASPAERRRGTLQWHWRARAEWSQESWTLPLVAVRHNVVVGTQDLFARRFALTREVSTGSWVGAAYQRQGIGTAMRRAVLHLAFAGLGAETARSGAFVDNTASVAISERLGYVADGTEVHAPRGRPATLQRWLLTRAVWEGRHAGAPAVDILGLDESLAMFGAGPPA